MVRANEWAPRRESISCPINPFHSDKARWHWSLGRVPYLTLLLFHSGSRLMNDYQRRNGSRLSINHDNGITTFSRTQPIDPCATTIVKNYFCTVYKKYKVHKNTSNWQKNLKNLVDSESCWNWEDFGSRVWRKVEFSETISHFIVIRGSWLCEFVCLVSLGGAVAVVVVVVVAAAQADVALLRNGPLPFLRHPRRIPRVSRESSTLHLRYVPPSCARSLGAN